MDQNLTGKTMQPGPYAPGRTDLDQMPDTPTRRSHHRRAQSETFFRFPEDLDDILFDDAVPELNLEPRPGPSQAPATLQLARPEAEPPKLSHFRSLSVDSDFFDGLVLEDNGGVVVGSGQAGSGPGTGPRHVRSGSFDGYSSATSFEAESGSNKKGVAADRLSELALVDPKRAKRILANRQSAARSKERKIRYTSELERKVQTLQTEATTLSAQITMLQRDTSGLTAENRELKLKLQALEQQAHLRDALNEALREELQRLKIAAGQAPATKGTSREMSSQFSSQRQGFNPFGNYQAQQQQQQQQQLQHQQQQRQQQFHISTPASTNPRNVQSQPGFGDFNRRV